MSGSHARGGDRADIPNLSSPRRCHNILGRYVSSSACGGGRYEIAMGAGRVAKGKAYGDSETELFAGVCGPTPTDVVITWAEVEKLLHTS